MRKVGVSVSTSETLIDIRGTSPSRTPLIYNCNGEVCHAWHKDSMTVVSTLWHGTSLTIPWIETLSPSVMLFPSAHVSKTGAYKSAPAASTDVFGMSCNHTRITYPQLNCIYFWQFKHNKHLKAVNFRQALHQSQSRTSKMVQREFHLANVDIYWWSSYMLWHWSSSDAWSMCSLQKVVWLAHRPSHHCMQVHTEQTKPWWLDMQVTHSLQDIYTYLFLLLPSRCHFRTGDWLLPPTQLHTQILPHAIS